MYEIGWQRASSFLLPLEPAHTRKLTLPAFSSAVGGLIGFWINYGVSEHIAISRKQWLIVRRSSLFFSFLLRPSSSLLLVAPSSIHLSH